MHSKKEASGKGQFGDLTDDLLRHVLSFLPAAYALQTCVLDTRWRDHWRRTTSLLLIFDQSSFPSSQRFKQLDCEYDGCSCRAYPIDKGVLLHGLSNAVNLELIGGTYTELFIYRWDLECCPIFDKLKTLSLNEWFTTIDLLCILQHSPVLEVLTLKLGSTKKFVRATGAEEKIEQSFVCSHLKIVNIECRKVDEGVHKILKFLSTCGILRDQISIKEQ